MDSDDISCNDRFERQLRYFEADNSLDIVGGDISEFIGEEKSIVSYGNVPNHDSEIKEYIKIRAPFNHVTVMFKKQAVLKAGNYCDWYYNEDYFLWLRMYLKNAIMANTGTVLVNVRVGSDMYRRRGGIKYFKSEARLQKYMLQNHIISMPLYLQNVLKRFIVQVLLPNRIRGFVFSKFAREIL